MQCDNGNKGQFIPNIQVLIQKDQLNSNHFIQQFSVWVCNIFKKIFEAFFMLSGLL